MRRGRWAVSLVGAAAVTGLLAGTAGAASLTNQEILTRGVITKADVPAGWKSTKQIRSGPSQFQKISACQAIYTAVKTAQGQPHKDSRTFVDPASPHQAKGGQDTVFAFKNAAVATKFLGVFQSDTTAACLRAVLQKQLHAGDTIDTVSPITDLQGVGDESVGYQFTVTEHDANGTPVTIVVDQLGVVSGRAVLEFTFQNPAGRIPEGPGIVTSVLDRLSTA